MQDYSIIVLIPGLIKYTICYIYAEHTAQFVGNNQQGMRIKVMAKQTVSRLKYARANVMACNRYVNVSFCDQYSQW